MIPIRFLLSINIIQNSRWDLASYCESLMRYWSDITMQWLLLVDDKKHIQIMQMFVFCRLLLWLGITQFYLHAMNRITPHALWQPQMCHNASKTVQSIGENVWHEPAMKYQQQYKDTNSTYFMG